MVSSVPSSTTAASSPLMQASVITSPAHGTPLVSPPVSSSDDEADPADADQAQQCQQRSANAELANFLALTQNPPAHLIAEPEPHAFVPFIAYKPRYLKSRRKVKVIFFAAPHFWCLGPVRWLHFYFLEMNAKLFFVLWLHLTFLSLSLSLPLIDVGAFVI
jgi:hypothetical protein